MNRYVTVRYLCGCKQELRVYGDEANKKRQHDRELKELCSDCWQYAVRTNTLCGEERERTKAMVISSQTKGLVPLERSEIKSDGRRVSVKKSKEISKKHPDV